MGTSFFLLPSDPSDNQAAVTNLVAAVPEHWGWVDGRLDAPPEAEPARVGLCIGGNHPYVVGDPANGLAGLADILTAGRPFAYIKLDQAGGNTSGLRFPLPRRIVLELLRQGYSGDLHFYRGSVAFSADNFPAQCSIHCKPWVGSALSDDEPGNQPARVRVQWEEEFGGRKKDIAPILAACHKLGLQAYTPEAPQVRQFRLGR